MDLEGCVQRWVSAPIVGARRLEWSSDGTRILVETLEDVRVLRAGTGAVASVERATEAAFRPGSRELALIRKRGDVSQVVVGSRVVFRGAGELRDLRWSPDGRWVLVAWPAADHGCSSARRPRHQGGLEHLRAVPLACASTRRGLVLRALRRRRA